MPSNRVTYRTLHGDIARTTDAAVLFYPDGEEDQKVWIPKSCLPVGEDDVDVNVGVDLQVAEWFCNKEGLN